MANKSRVIRLETLKSILTQIGSPRKNGLSFQSDADLDSFFEGLRVCISNLLVNQVNQSRYRPGVAQMVPGS